MLLIQTLFIGLLFLGLAWFVFYNIGYAVLRFQKNNLADQEIITLAFSLGLVIFTGIAILLGLVSLRWMLLPLVLAVGCYNLIKYKKESFAPWKIFIRKKTLLWLIILGILVQGFINFPSGLRYAEGLLFWSSQGHDGLWHVSLMEEIRKNFPPQNPIFSGEKLFNYHYLVDVLMGDFYRIFPFFSPLDLYFRFFPIIFSFLFGLGVFSFVKRWQNSNAVGYLALFFTYFTGSFGYVVTFFRNKNLFGGETVFWASQENTLLGNPPHAIAHIFLVAILLCLLLYFKDRKKFFLILAFILGSLLFGFKVSGGFVMLAGVAAAALADLIFHRKWHSVVLAAVLGISNFFTFKLMTSKEAASFLMFLPWWFIRTMVVDKLGWIDLELRRQTYIAEDNWKRVIQLEVTAFLIFLVGNLGMRILGFWGLVKDLVTKKFIKSPIDAMLFVSMLTGFLMVIIFVQKGIIYNNIQFIQYSLLIMGFYAAVSTYQLLMIFRKKLIRATLFMAIVLLSVPTVIGNLNEFYGPGRKPLAIISNQQIQALSFLKANSGKEDIILTVPFNKYLKDRYQFEPRPINAWYSTPYVSALAARHTYFTAEEQALITGYPIDKKLAKTEEFFAQTDFSNNKRFLAEEGIKYLYIVKDELDKALSVQENNLEIMFENEETIIYKVNQKV
ncbi:hypothetical protein HYT74_04065 [Candidatus Daviesbacteria bacterium]|nr:hypothetical protein [Candidatus Daviesbacteria bacterium]